jgi:hypothetical protein
MQLGKQAHLRFWDLELEICDLELGAWDLKNP